MPMRKVEEVVAAAREAHEARQQMRASRRQGDAYERFSFQQHQGSGRDLLSELQPVEVDAAG